MDTEKATEALETRVDKGKAKQIPGNVQPRDAFITVIGASESATSTFMEACSGKDSVGIEHGLMKVIFEYNGLKVHLINVPGFGDRAHADTDPLILIASYFAAMYQFHIELNGIIYISPERIFDVTTNNVNLFFKMIGDDASSKVVLATDGWNITGASGLGKTATGRKIWIPDRVKVEARENHLRERFCRPFIEKGSKVCRLDGGKEAAFHILDVLLPGGETERQVLKIQRELVDDMTTLDETEAGHQLLTEIRKRWWWERGPEDGRKQLQVGFERLVREKWDVNASLFRRLEREKMEKAVVIDKLNYELRTRSAQVQPKETDHRTAKSPHAGKARSQLETHIPSIQRLTDEIKRTQRYVTRKEARMREIRGLMLEVLSDTRSSPPRAHTQSATPRAITGRQTHLQNTPSYTSHEARNSDEFGSYIARNETQRESQQGRENAPRSDVRAVRPRRPRVNYLVLEEEREKFRVQLYQNSLLAFEQDTDSQRVNNPILQRRSTDMRDVDALCNQYRFSIGDRQELQDLLSHTLTAMAKGTLTFGAWLFYQSYLLRNAILMVYHNCRKLQTAELAGAWFSILVLEPSSNSRTRVVNLSRVEIDDVREVVERLSSFVTVLQDLISEHTVPHSVSTLTRLSDEVHLLYRKIFERLGLENLMSDHRHRYALSTDLESVLSSRSSGGSAYFVDVFAQWWCATRALDVGVIAYEKGHVSDSEQTFSVDLGSKLPQLGAFKLQSTLQRPEYPKSLQYVSRGLNCLAGFFQRYPVWILAMGEASNNLYLAADIETFADAWGPVWKVVHQSQPELIAKYNVNGGSIVPWPSNPDIHPKLRSNERLCHWKSNDEYIYRRDDIAANVDSSPSSSDSDQTEEDLDDIEGDSEDIEGYSDYSEGDSDDTKGKGDEIEENPDQATSFSGNEILIIGADQDARLQSYDRHYSIDGNQTRPTRHSSSRLYSIINQV